MKLFVNTLGGFDIRASEQSLFKESARTYKLYKLFQYFITFRNKKLLPETIIDNLLPDSGSSDPKNVLRTQIFRLRKAIKLLLPKNAEDNQYVVINFVNGYYCLELGESTILDIEEFESLINQGDNECQNNIENAIVLYEKAIKLYKGVYLSEYSYEVWLVPTRNYYHRLYLKTLFNLIEIIKEKGDNESIIKLCEQALMIDSYEEDIHIKILEAMLNSGHYKNALKHYDYTIIMLEKEMGVKPSPKFLEMKRKIQNNSLQTGEIDISEIKKKLGDSIIKDGAMYCDFELFKSIFNLQKRKSYRKNENDYIGSITLNIGQYKNYNSNDLDYWSKSITQIIEESLRKGDVFTLWNNSQVLIILHDVKNDGVSKVKDRIRKSIKSHADFNKYDISIMFQTLITDDIII